MRSNVILALTLVTLLVLGCLDNQDPPVVGAGVPDTERSYFEGSVWITERVVEVHGHYQTTVTFQGSATNYGTDLADARYELLAADIVTNMDGSVTYRDEGVVATQQLGAMPRNCVLPLNLSYSYPSVAQVRVRARFVGQ